MTFARCCLIALAVATSAGCKPDPEAKATATATPSVAAPQPALSAPAPAVLGSALYGNHCVACHGQPAEGGMGPALAGVGKRLDEQALRRVVALGRPAQGMPGLGTRLTSGEIEAVVAYLRTI